MPCVSCAITSEMPIELATLRIRVSIEVPSVRRWLGSVRNATVDSGTNTRPKPKPWTTLTMTISGHAGLVGPARSCRTARPRSALRPEMISVRASI